MKADEVLEVPSWSETVQVTQTYSPVTARMDHSLLQYGFVEEHNEPLLAAVDSATGFEHEDDSLYGK